MRPDAITIDKKILTEFILDHMSGIDAHIDSLILSNLTHGNSLEGIANIASLQEYKRVLRTLPLSRVEKIYLTVKNR